MPASIAIPYDMYESHTHLLCVIPMGGVDKSSVMIKLRDHALHINATRHKPDLDHDFVRIQHECYWWSISCIIDLPTRIDYDGIESTLSSENILSIMIPKKSPPDSDIPVAIEK